ncbi:hypothetical protein K435DRAFT_865058 [Dendrothele bispora CBS 962.96]|uniref:CENP-V/GFA domain-containing protein n=1 Tax=Dendrothele bispora (strain CBS 962.96) TaxID=1314807 RepID=A0A4S8LKH2_DENBC|nr:hypothetical protein K435DRAFT_865058 [Dendrothele bispora CBS 962.96]
MSTATPKHPSITGGCVCESIRYQISFPEGSVYPPNPCTCQCTTCRKHSGALIVHFITVQLPQITWLSPTNSDSPPNRPSEIHTSSKAVRYFCAKCGTSLAFKLLELDELELMAGTLDEDVLNGPHATELTRPIGAQFFCKRVIEGTTDFIMKSEDADLKKSIKWVEDSSEGKKLD